MRRKSKHSHGQENQEEQKYICKSDLFSRPGWTEAGLKNFGIVPDAERENPHYRRAASVKLFLLEKILAFEKTSQFREWLEKNLSRSVSAQKAVITKTESLLDKVKKFNVSVRKVQNVVDRGIRSYNEWNCTCVTRNENREFLDRITVNYIRHNLTRYDENLYEIFGKTGKSQAYMECNRRIYLAIARVYPEFGGECCTQFHRKFGVDLEIPDMAKNLTAECPEDDMSSPSPCL